MHKSVWKNAGTDNNETMVWRDDQATTDAATGALDSAYEGDTHQRAGCVFGRIIQIYLKQTIEDIFDI